MSRRKKEPTQEEIKLEVAKSKSDNLRQKVEDVYSLKGDSKKLRSDIIGNSIFAGLGGILSILSLTDVFKTRKEVGPLGKICLVAWFLGIAIEEGFSAYRNNKQKKDVDSDIVILEDDIFTEERLTMVK